MKFKPKRLTFFEKLFNSPNNNPFLTIKYAENKIKYATTNL